MSSLGPEGGIYCEDVFHRRALGSCLLGVARRGSLERHSEVLLQSPG
jgi:hypothetical protein